jgi:hypothetical protein
MRSRVLADFDPFPPGKDLPAGFLLTRQLYVRIRAVM